MTSATNPEASNMDSILGQIVDAAGFKIGEQYSAQRVVQRLLDQGRQHGDEKVVELMRERQKLHEAMAEARECLQDVPVDASAAFRARTAYNILSRALGFGDGADRDDFEAARRLAEQAMERD